MRADEYKSSHLTPAAPEIRRQISIGSLSAQEGCIGSRAGVGLCSNQPLPSLEYR